MMRPSAVISDNGLRSGLAGGCPLELPGRTSTTTESRCSATNRSEPDEIRTVAEIGPETGNSGMMTLLAVAGGVRLRTMNWYGRSVVRAI